MNARTLRLSLALAAIAALAPISALAAPVPTESVVTTADEFELRLRTFGDDATRPPVVMLTGGPGFAGEQLRSVAEALGETRRVLLPDQRGTGRSNPGPLVIDAAVYNYAQAVSDLEAVRESIGAETWSLAGHSWGGLLAMLYACEHPERVESIALISPAGVESAFWRHYQQNIFNNLTDAERQGIGDIPLPEDDSPEALATYIMGANKAMAPAMLARKEATDALRAEMTPENFNPTVSLSMQDEMQNYDLRDELATLAAPVLIIQGDADPVGRMTADQILDTIPNSTIHVIKQCGHWPMFETPDVLNAALRDFFGGE